MFKHLKQLAIYLCYPIDMIATGVDIIFDVYINDDLVVPERFQVHNRSNDKYIIMYILIHAHIHTDIDIYLLCRYAMAIY